MKQTRLNRREALVAGMVGALLAHGAHAAAQPPSWSFSLPTLAGDRFVELASFKGPVLVNFWGRDCPPCLAELPRLEAFAAANPHWTLLLISTDPPQLAREAAQRFQLKATVLRAGSNVQGLMKRAGNIKGALPFSVVAHNNSVVAHHSGEVSDANLQLWAKRFAQ